MTVSYLVVRGHKINDLLNCSFAEKCFYIESVNKHIKEENKKLGGE